MTSSSKAIQQVMNGSYYDKIVGYLRYGIEKCPLDAEHKEIFDRIEYAKDLWLNHNDDTYVVKQLIGRYQVSRAQAYNYLADAKRLHSLFANFNTMAELLLLKQRIDEAYALAQANPKEFGKLFPQALSEHRKWIEAMRDEQERQKPEANTEYHFHYHFDITKLPGVTPELNAEWETEFDELASKARKRFNATDVTDAEYTVEQ